MTRQGVMFRLSALLRQHQSKIAASIVKEQGKTMADAEGDVLRGIQVAEFACSIPTLMMGETVSTVATDMDSCVVCHSCCRSVTSCLVPPVCRACRCVFFAVVPSSPSAFRRFGAPLKRRRLADTLSL